ncbi:Tad domain-containing protein [Aceticella autotrophica]|uniref:Tad domain-containing protein n=1 Tax=Aceticella autotrophica TaxID=2755338 RepID=A0A975GAR9_9THEO|nr:Tad domain-containing protein [Aceticella autotrophica]QSZ27595.1 Tad domain-containing protein [Aceticella autotrophica]
MIKDNRGNAVLMVIIFMMFATVGIVGFDYVRAHAVRARLQTACDAASLAACKQAVIMPMYKTKMYDSNNNETTDPSQAAKIQDVIIGYHADLKPVPPSQLKSVADSVFNKNMQGINVPVKSALVPVGTGGNSSNDTFESSKMNINEGIDFNKPYVCNANGQYYYEANAGVRSFLYNGILGKWITNIQHDSNMPNYIPIKTYSESQALSPK